MRLLAQWDGNDFHDAPQRVKHRWHHQTQQEYKVDVIEDALQDGWSKACII